MFGGHLTNYKEEDIFRCFLCLIFLRHCSLAGLLLLGDFSDKEIFPCLVFTSAFSGLCPSGRIITVSVEICPVNLCANCFHKNWCVR